MDEDPFVTALTATRTRLVRPGAVPAIRFSLEDGHLKERLELPKKLKGPFSRCGSASSLRLRFVYRRFQPALGYVTSDRLHIFWLENLCVTLSNVRSTCKPSCDLQFGIGRFEQCSKARI
jgi:hypothetical protein